MRLKKQTESKIDRQTKRYYLSHVDLFQDIDDKEMEEMEPLMPMRRVSKGYDFFMPGDPVEDLFVIKKGRVKLYRIAPDGRVLTIAILKTGHIFGKLSMLGLAPHGTGAQAMDEALVCTMTKNLTRQCIMNYPKVGLRLLDQMEKRLYEMEKRLEELSFGTVSSRLAKVLLQLDAEGKNVIEDFTHQEFADILGVYRETITQTLSNFRKSGLIKLARKRIAILRRGEIETIAKSME